MSTYNNIPFSNVPNIIRGTGAIYSWKHLSDSSFLLSKFVDRNGQKLTSHFDDRCARNHSACSLHTSVNVC